MPFEKGKSGNKAGRPKGSPNKLTAENRERIQILIDKIHTKYLDSDLDKLEPDKRISVLISLYEYVTPKLARTELSGPDGDAIKLPKFSWTDGTEHNNSSDRSNKKD